MKYQRVGLRTFVGSFVCPAQIGLYEIVDVGFRPKRVFFFVSESPGIQGRFSCGSGSADNLGNQQSMTWAGASNQGQGQGGGGPPGGLFRGDSSGLKCISVTDVVDIVVEADLAQMTDSGFVLNFTKVDPSFTVRWEVVA